jgi:hypothetical protein
MRKFVVNILLMVLAVCLAYLIIFCLIPAGKIGDVYPRVITPRQHSLVIGTSRAAQGIDPDILNERLREVYPAGDLYNFAFHIDETTYNEIYFSAIMKKLTADRGHGLFILSVDPWAFKRDNQILGEVDLHSVSVNPNLEYLVRFFNRTWISPLPTHVYVNSSGRSVVTGVKRNPSMIASKLQTYREMALHYAYDEASERVFVRLIDSLKSRGDVYAVRMPVAPEMVALEDSVMPDFSTRISELVQSHGAVYLDFIRESFDTNDGNHLTKEEGDRFSELLAERIRAIH